MSTNSSTYTAFAGGRRVARGSYADVALALAAQAADGTPVLVFDDATGAQIDTPHAPEHAARLASLRHAAPAAGSPATVNAEQAPARAGRPRLGVVAREVTLLPRHWDWLASQRGGASAALRRRVGPARRQSEAADQRRAAGERSYKFMSAIAGHLPGFEEAARALFAADGRAFAQRVAAWPRDVRTHLQELAEGAFDAPADAPAEATNKSASTASTESTPSTPAAKALKPSSARKGAAS